MADIHEVDPGDAAARAAILAILDGDSRAKGYVFAPSPLVLALRAGDRVVGGLVGHSNWDWFYVEIVSVHDELRGRGFGRMLMERAEGVARDRGCVGIWVDTISFQAPAFYEGLGYEVFGRLDDHPRGQTRFFFRKRIA
jgi:GNAT superfamily N-acetyltransferase